MQRKRYWLLVAVAVYSTTLFFLSVSSPVGLTPALFSVDVKLHHVAAFALQVVLLHWVWKKPLWAPLLIAFSFGLLIELTQHFLPHRSGQWQDLLQNLLGIGLGYLWIWAEAVTKRQFCQGKERS